MTDQQRQGPSAPPGSGRDSGRLMRPGEVAGVLRVDPKTVTRWADEGRLRSVRTAGGHRRFSEADIRAILNGDPQ